MPGIRIHHLSDIHFGASQFQAAEKLSILPAATERNTNVYLEHLARLGPSEFPDLIVISGDLTTLASEDEMGRAEDFILKICKLPAWNGRRAFPAGCPRVVVVPGNHDLDWGRDTPDHKHERFARMSDVVHRNGEVLSSRHRAHQFSPYYDFGDEANLFIYLLNSTPYGGTDDPHLARIHSEIVASAAKAVTPETLQALSKQVKKDPGFVTESDLQAMRKAAATVPKRRIKIAVVHHNANHVPSDDREQFDTIVNSGPLKSALLEAGFHIVLHGHRHIFHCSVEYHPATAYSGSQCFFVSADSLGCKENAPFLELEVAGGSGGSVPDADSARLVVREFGLSSPNGYGGPATRCETALTRVAAEELNDLLSDRDGSAGGGDRMQTLAKLLPKLQLIQGRLSQWHEKGSAWITEFHFQLQKYQRLWATAPYNTAVLTNSLYQGYLREQYTERMARLSRQKEKTLYFSPELRKAISKRRWQPANELWGEYKMERAGSASQGLEIARIIILGDERVDPASLQNMAYDHALFAIPLFVIEKKWLPAERVMDFALGLDADGAPIKACALDAKDGVVREQRPLDAYDLVNTFEQILANPHLRTVSEWLGKQPMWTDRPDEFTDKYVKARKASPLLLEILSRHLPSQGEGVDLGCGTGNYTAPFFSRFSKLWGVDISPQMIAKAKERHPRVEWIQSDAKETPLLKNSCAGAWMISALHYFLADEQPLLFREVYRILAPDGVFVADTEFLEQHPSLWIVDYFPSLRERFQGKLFTRAQYQLWLQQAGFVDVAFEHYDYLPDQGDAFLRIGQHRPEVYLDPAVQEAIPAFLQMNPSERKKGFDRLRDEIATGETARIRESYLAKAELKGDLGIIIARKPPE